MPRPGPRRRAVPLRLSEDEERPVRHVADDEHSGNLSDAIRALIADGLTYRQIRALQPTDRTGE